MQDDEPRLGEDLEIEDDAELTPLPRLVPQDAPFELWRTLRPGDRVRLHEVPAEFLAFEGELRDDTLAMYRHLVESRTVLTVQHVDAQDARPWTEIAWDREGAREHHFLALNHSGLSLVEGA